MRFPEGLRRFDSAFWRSVARRGALLGPRWWLGVSPPVIGLVAMAGTPAKRRLVEETLARVDGRVDRSRVAWTYVRFAQSFAESFLTVAPEGRRPTVVTEGVSRLLGAIQAGRGVVLVTAHTAGWEIGLAELGRVAKVEVAVAMDDEADPSARAEHSAIGASGTARVVSVGPDPLAALSLLSVLRRGGVVAIPIDRYSKGMRTRPVVLFGGSARMPEGPFRLAALAGSPMVMVLSERTGFLRYRVCISEPRCVAAKRDDVVLDAVAQRFAEDLERFVVHHPTQWFRFAPWDA